jgi:hypothetical protein
MWGEGAAVLRYYQNFGHLQAAVLTWVTGLGPETSTVIVNALYMLGYPWAMFWCTRKFGFSKYHAAVMGFVTLVCEGEKVPAVVRG